MTKLQPTWRKSSYSLNAGNCVEVATVANRALVRDSKQPDTGHLSFDHTALAALVDACTTGQLDDLTD